MFQEEEIRRGMALLDEKVPGWERKVKPEVLNISSFIQCILGQVYGSYMRGIVELSFDRDRAIEHGFLIPVAKSMGDAFESGRYNLLGEFNKQSLDESKGLDKTWRSLLADRLASPV